METGQKKERQFPSIYWFIPQMTRSKPGAQSSIQASHMDGGGPKHLAIFHYLPRHTNRELNRK